MIFTEKLSSYINANTALLDVGCGHGKFTSIWSSRAKEVIGIDITKGFIDTANRIYSKDNTKYLLIDATGQLPFPDNYFDVVYTKKGPWPHKEGGRIGKPGSTVIGIYPGGTDGGLRDLFSNLYEPLPNNPYDIDGIMNLWKFNESIGLKDFHIEVIEEVEYLSTPEDVLVKRCFGQNKTIRELVWKECLKNVEEVFYNNADSKGLKVINYYHLVTSRIAN
jgi:SAM-dependent methyltransferase